MPAARVLVPGRRTRPIQIIDARDLAGWTVKLTEEKVNGVFNAAGPEPALTMEQFLGHCLNVSQGGAQLAWLTDEQVLAAGIEAWTELPLWVPENDTDAGGIFYADNRCAMGRGLGFRPVAQTINDFENGCPWYIDARRVVSTFFVPFPDSAFSRRASSASISTRPASSSVDNSCRNSPSANFVLPVARKSRFRRTASTTARASTAVHCRRAAPRRASFRQPLPRQHPDMKSCHVIDSPMSVALPTWGPAV